MPKYEYILFDVAGTLLYKPSFFDKILGILKDNGYEIKQEDSQTGASGITLKPIEGPRVEPNMLKGEKNISEISVFFFNKNKAKSRFILG